MARILKRDVYCNYDTPIVFDPYRTAMLQYVSKEEIDAHFKKLFPESHNGYRDVPVTALSKKEFEELRHKSIMETWENIINENSI
jgi:hypothetical protein